MYSTLEQFIIIKSCNSATELRFCKEDLEQTQAVHPYINKLIEKRMSAFLTLDLNN